MPSLAEPHFNRGTLPLAFVFSVAGADEPRESKPVAGDTGKNLAIALKVLSAEAPTVFVSADRYAYRITNAFSAPMAISLGSKASEAKASQILESENVRRIIKELQGCNLVVLCGRKAQLLTREVVQPGQTIVHAWHTGNRALIAKYKGTEVKVAPTALARQELRTKLWAKDLLEAIRGTRAA